MSKKTRRHHTPDQKINLLRRHHLEKVPVSEVCEGAELQPSVVYDWQRRLFEHGAAAFGESRKRVEPSREQELQAEVERLKARLADLEGHRLRPADRPPRDLGRTRSQARASPRAPSQAPRTAPPRRRRILPSTPHISFNPSVRQPTHLSRSR